MFGGAAGAGAEQQPSGADRTETGRPDAEGVFGDVFEEVGVSCRLAFYAPSVAVHSADDVCRMISRCSDPRWNATPLFGHMLVPRLGQVLGLSLPTYLVSC
jgi:hypothetical protein